MTSATVKRVFEVDAPLEEAWYRLAEVERWPEWAPHITSVTVSPPGELGPTSSGAFQIKRLGRNTFRMSVWEPPVRWEWVGGLPGVRTEVHALKYAGVDPEIAEGFYGGGTIGGGRRPTSAPRLGRVWPDGIS